MKKFFTNHSKCSLAIIAAVTALISAFSATADEYKSMIRYDRVWEYINMRWTDRQVYHVKFDGQEEINGKTYHRLVAFRKASYSYNSDRQPYLFDVIDDYYNHEGYLREEDGKVYTLIIDKAYGNEYKDIQLYTQDFSESDSSAIEEKLLYDFTCKEEETYSGLMLGAELDYKINSIEHVEIDGEEHRLQRVTVYDDWNEEWYEFFNEPIVEGIGIANNGCLTTINFLDLPTCPCYNHIFNRLLSTEGKVLYRSEDMGVDLPLNDFMGIEDIAEQPESDAPLYDILGRRITNPAPGQLYIQGGKKHIAK